jgi:hypothetical protein
MSYASLQSRTRDTNHGHGLNEKWRRIGWNNICKLWLQQRTPEELKGQGKGKMSKRIHLRPIELGLA